MNQEQFCKRLMLWVGLALALIALVIGLCFGKVIEGSLFAEIAKWIVMGLVVIGILEGFIYSSLGGIIYHFWYEKREKK